MTAPRTDSVPSVERALRLLEVLASAPTGLTLSQLVRQLPVPKSTLHMLVVTFEREGYLTRDEESGRYRIALKLYGLADLAITCLPLRHVAATSLQALAQRTRMTVHMAVLERGEAVLVEKVEPHGITRQATWIGKRMDLHCTAVGKALIAFLPEAELDRVLQRTALLRHNDNTIVSVRKLKEHLARVRKLGYALDDEEEELGMRCIGAPVYDAMGIVLAGISLASPVSRFGVEQLEGLAADVQRTASLVSQRLVSG